MAEDRDTVEVGERADPATSATPPESPRSPKSWLSLSPEWVGFWTAFWYALGVLVVCGGAGIWLPIAMPFKMVQIDALTTFVLATLAPLSVDLLLDAEIYGQRFSKHSRSLLATLSVVAVALSITALLREHNSGAWELGTFAAILTLVIWMTIAIKSGRFMPIGSHAGSIGGTGIPQPEGLAGGGLPE